ncbi:MAG: M20 family metallo-hydrolase [Deltaproteobacteria bacterium]|nr:M20 family metallo-hydrolase [Deltaproteobacteria bacterium]
MPVSKEIFDRLTKRIDSYRDEMVEFQIELTKQIALGPDNGGDGEWKRAEFLKDKITAFGLSDISEYNAEDKRVPEGTRPNLVVRLKGKTAKPTVWVMAHMDIVPPGDEKLWDSNPHEAIVKDGKIYGRGTEDNQQGLVSSLFAMRALIEEKIAPSTDICLMLVADEETGNEYGIDYVLKSNPDLVDKNDIVIVPDGGNPDGSMVEVAEKSILWCGFEILGKQVHASMPQAGINAHRASAHLVVRLDQQLHQEYSRQDPVFDPPGSTFEPTQREANVPNINTIPGKEVLYFDCRILPDYSVDDVLATINKIAAEVAGEFKVEIKVTQPMIARAAPATSTEAPVVKIISEAILEVSQVKPQPMGIGGGTVAALFRKHGIPAVVWSTMDDLAHQPNEYCVIDNLVLDTKVFAYVFINES